MRVLPGMNSVTRATLGGEKETPSSLTILGCAMRLSEAFQGLLALGLRDAFRLFEDGEKLYSWWDYRMMAFRRNMGMRIDHILISAALQCSGCHIDKAPRKLERPSDHTPVVADVA
jgi:exodeoxyribonuclease-3